MAPILLEELITSNGLASSVDTLYILIKSPVAACADCPVGLFPQGSRSFPVNLLGAGRRSSAGPSKRESERCLAVAARNEREFWEFLGAPFVEEESGRTQ